MQPRSARKGGFPGGAERPGRPAAYEEEDAASVDRK